MKTRTAAHDDCALLWKWVNEPAVRSSSFHTAPVAWEDHQTWFARKREDPNCVLYIVTDEGDAPIGQIRFEIQGEDAEVDMSIAPERRGHGYGAEALRLGSKKFFQEHPMTRVVAHIKPDNFHSIRSFEKAGFLRDGEERVQGHDSLRMTLHGEDTRKTVAIYVEGGKGVGLGHAARSLGLAGALRKEGYSVVFLIAPDSQLESFLGRDSHQILVCPPSPGHLIDRFHRLQAVSLIIDSYRFQGKDLAEIKTGVPFLACFDDLANRDLPVDMVVNGSPAAKALTYKTPNGAIRLFGLEYQVVRPDFSAEIPKIYPPSPRSILVTMGGDDNLGIAKDMIDFFQKFLSSKKGLEVDFVIGPFVHGHHVSQNPSVRIHRHPRDMRALMIQADIAVSAGGQTLYELARCGTPTIAYCMAEDQLPNLEALEKEKCLRYLGWAKGEAWLQTLERTLEEWLASSEERRSFGRRFQSLVDGRGAERIAREIGRRIPS